MSRMKETLDEYDDERRSDPSLFTPRQAHELEIQEYEDMLSICEEHLAWDAPPEIRPFYVEEAQRCSNMLEMLKENGKTLFHSDSSTGK